MLSEASDIPLLLVLLQDVGITASIKLWATGCVHGIIIYQSFVALSKDTRSVYRDTSKLTL